MSSYAESLALKIITMKKEKIEKLISLGSEITGASVGGVVGFFLAGPVGSAAGGAIGVAISQGIQEVAERTLSAREGKRVGAVIIYAEEKIREKLNSGALPRNDGFFDSQLGQRSPADEIIEGVLLAAKQDYEEKKLPYYANLLANIAFQANVDKITANALLKLAERLSYRQLSYISLMAQRSTFNLHAQTISVADFSNKQNYLSYNNISVNALVTEILDLIQNNVIMRDPNGIEQQNIIARLTNLGYSLFNLMELSKIPEIDVRNTLELLIQSDENSPIFGLNIGYMPIAENNIVLEQEQRFCLLIKDDNGYTIDGIKAKVSSSKPTFPDKSTVTYQNAPFHTVMEDAMGNKYYFSLDIEKLLTAESSAANL